jgi:hypothetical protein
MPHVVHVGYELTNGALSAVDIHRPERVALGL